MRKITSVLAAAAIAVCFAGEVSAQGGNRQPGGRGGMAGGMFGQQSVYLLLKDNKDLQTELKITDDQKPKIAEVDKTQRAKLTELMPARGAGGGGGARPTAEEIKERQDKMTKFNAETKKAFEAVLTTEQAARAAQINIQMMSVRAFSNAEVQTSLKMTDDQKETVKSIMETYMKDVMELGGGRGGFQRGGGAPSEEDKKKAEENAKKREALTKDTEEKIVAKLSDDQKKMWTEMVGAKFDVSKLRTAPMARPRDN